MSEPKSMPFSSSSGMPTVVEVTAEDGQKYLLRLQIAVVDVVETGKLGPDGNAGFEVRAAIAIDTVPTHQIAIAS